MSRTAPALGRYELGDLLGSGGMALVYTARDTVLERRVAVKVLADNLAADDGFRRRFVREARSAARLSHTNIVRVYDVGEVRGRPFIVMEHIDGQTLAAHVRERGRLTEPEAVTIAGGLAAALAHAHAAGVLHRDVKPQNVLVTPDGEAKLVDFGIARPLDGTELTEPGTLLGTAAYLAPEQALGATVTAAADVYALGVVLYELLTGQLPSEAATLGQVLARHSAGERRTSEAQVRDSVPNATPALGALVAACLAHEPTRRPTAAAVARALAGLAPKQTAPGDPVRIPARTPATAATPTRVLLAPARAGATRRRAGALLGLVAVGGTIAAALTWSGGGFPTQPARPAPLPSAPAAQAQSLAAWLRAHAR